MKIKNTVLKVSILACLIIASGIIINFIVIPKLSKLPSLYPNNAQQHIITMVDTTYNDKFYISIFIYDLKEKRIAVSIEDKKSTIIQYKDIKSDMAEEILNNHAWSTDIIKEYRDDNITAYKFNWCILYSDDNGDKFSCVVKRDYQNKISTDGVFKKIYTMLGAE